jgi:integrase/recombinase XerD
MGDLREYGFTKTHIIMSFKKSEYYTVVQQANDSVPGFKAAYQQFVEQATIAGSSRSLVTNYSRSIAQVALHFGQLPHRVTAEEINSYLYRISVHEGKSEGYFKQTVFGLRYWFRVFGLEERALRMPPIKKKKSLPVVLSKQECKELFKAPRSLKHRFLLALAYSAGLRMNELRLLKRTDVDLQRLQIHVRQGKGGKDRYVVLSQLIAQKIPLYLQQEKPRVYLFEGNTPGHPLGERSIQYVINEALAKTSIPKHVSMHTLRHSFATHLLEDGIDIYSIQKLLGHSHIDTTIVYLHIAQVRPVLAHSPLDSLYGLPTRP